MKHLFRFVVGAALFAGLMAVAVYPQVMLGVVVIAALIGCYIAGGLVIGEVRRYFKESR